MTSNLHRLAEVASQRPTIHERLTFPPKPTEGYVIVRFLEDEPREFTYHDAITGEQNAPGLAINVACLAGDLPGVYGVRSLTMRADAENALTAGVLKLWAAKANKLKGVEAYVELRNYVHKEHGESRGYVVYERPR